MTPNKSIALQMTTSKDETSTELVEISGQWNEEPDQAYWVCPETGYECVIRRNDMGAFCGYVGVPSSHAYYKVYCEHLENIDVHGGLTFSHLGASLSKKSQEWLWWFGFDCAHYQDLIPLVHWQLNDGECVYRDFKYVTAEVTSLAKQLRGIANEI